MTREEIISGLKMSMELTLFDPSTGEVMEPRQLNDINRTAYEAYKGAIELLEELPSVQSEPKTGHWILDRSGAYCCSKCMEPCATYAMMKPRDKFCKMCGSRNEVAEWCQ